MTTKSLTEISELMNTEFLAYKKCCNYVADSTDDTLREKLGSWANNHRVRFEVLLSYLNSHE